METRRRIATALGVGLAVVLGLLAPAPTHAAGPATLTAEVWAAAPGERVQLTGRVPAGPRPVVLQRLAGRSWKAVARSTADRSGKLSFAVRTRATSTTYRVLAPAQTRGARRLAKALTPRRTVTTLQPGQHRGRIAAVPGTTAAPVTAAALSDDGTVVTYLSDARLTRDDTDDFADLYRFEVATGTRTMVPLADGLAPWRVATSADGRYVAFSAHQLEGGGSAPSGAFVHDVASGTTDLVSTHEDGSALPGTTDDIDISADGRYVAYSYAPPWRPGGEVGDVVHLHDRRDGVTTVVSETATGDDPDGYSAAVTVSDDGSRVAFHSDATNLVARDTNGRTDVFVRDVLAGTTIRVSTADDGSQLSGDSLEPDLSADGTIVAFWSEGPGLAAGVKRGDEHVYRHDLETGRTTLVSRSRLGRPGNSYSRTPVVSADGRYVAFTSCASDLLRDADRALFDVFLRDVERGATSRVAKTEAGMAANRDSSPLGIGADGRVVLFGSSATNLVSGVRGEGGLYLWRAAG